jgi:hypothetical protein
VLFVVYCCEQEAESELKAKKREHSSLAKKLATAEVKHYACHCIHITIDASHTAQHNFGAQHDDCAALCMCDGFRYDGFEIQSVML